eukprot:TRINITY_DN273_c0_g1_i1.p1 TRINITY_DN273_c0_g1~~TRINITY_DN273_c0_g1_i1.p1  ORF type:complete len:984 (+),score=303.69 TRINITY_DN273_c0_g1_i1:143-3094(+)
MRLTVDKLSAKLGKIVDYREVTQVDLSSKDLDELGSFKNCARLIQLDLRNNRFQLFRSIEGVFEAEYLEDLALTGSPVCRLPNYRLNVIAHMPQLKTLDLEPVTAAERQQAYKVYPDKKALYESFVSNPPPALDISVAPLTKKGAAPVTNPKLFDDDDDSDFLSTATSKIAAPKAPTQTANLFEDDDTDDAFGRPAATAKKPAAPAAATTTSVALFGDVDDKDVDDMFTKTAPTAKKPVAQTSSLFDAADKETDDMFGTSTAAASQQPAPQGGSLIANLLAANKPKAMSDKLFDSDEDEWESVKQTAPKPPMATIVQPSKPEPVVAVSPKLPQKPEPKVATPPASPVVAAVPSPTTPIATPIKVDAPAGAGAIPTVDIGSVAAQDSSLAPLPVTAMRARPARARGAPAPVSPSVAISAPATSDESGDAPSEQPAAPVVEEEHLAVAVRQPSAGSVRHSMNYQQAALAKQAASFIKRTDADDAPVDHEPPLVEERPEIVRHTGPVRLMAATNDTTAASTGGSCCQCKCTTFRPHAWQKTKCADCSHTLANHPADGQAPPPAPAPPAAKPFVPTGPPKMHDDGPAFRKPAPPAAKPVVAPTPAFTQPAAVTSLAPAVVVPAPAAPAPAADEPVVDEHKPAESAPATPAPAGTPAPALTPKPAAVTPKPAVTPKTDSAPASAPKAAPTWQRTVQTAVPKPVIPPTIGHHKPAAHTTTSSATTTPSKPAAPAATTTSTPAKAGCAAFVSHQFRKNICRDCGASEASHSAAPAVHEPVKPAAVAPVSKPAPVVPAPKVEEPAAPAPPVEEPVKAAKEEPVVAKPPTPVTVAPVVKPPTPVAVAPVVVEEPKADPPKVDAHAKPAAAAPASAAAVPSWRKTVGPQFSVPVAPATKPYHRPTATPAATPAAPPASTTAKPSWVKPTLTPAPAASKPVVAAPAVTAAAPAVKASAPVAAAATSKACSEFKPQQWKKTKCMNCFEDQTVHAM